MEVLHPLVIAGLVLTEVAMWQWRMVIAHRGRRGGAMLLGVVGAALQITAITQVVANVHDPFSIVAYAGGVGCGVLFGLIAGDRLTPGSFAVTIISAVPDFGDELWRHGWAATVQHGHRRDGPVAIVSLGIDRRDENRLRRDAHGIDPAASLAVKEVRRSPANERTAGQRRTSQPARASIAAVPTRG